MSIRSDGTAGGVDLSSCDREPIHIPGAIQPHGVLIAVREPDLTVVAASVNLGAACGTEAADALGRPFAPLLEEDSAAQVHALLSGGELAGASPFPLWFRGAATGGGRPWHAMLHRHGGLALLEAESPAAATDGPAVARGLFPAISGAIERLQAAPDTRALCDDVVREVRRLTGFDRVKLYRFHPDWSGEVVAEDRAEPMPSYLGLNFPASDIPAQARELYRINADRLIPDAGYAPVPILVAPELGSVALDLTHAQLRAVSPVHLEYLGNMGVGASMSVSVLRSGRLWGLIACHHARPHRVTPERRQACRLLAQVLSWQLAVADEAAAVRHSAAARALQARVLEETARGRDYRDAILRHAGELLDLMRAGGFALVTADAVTTVGLVPPEGEIRDLAAWLAARGEAEAFDTDRLPSLYAPAARHADVASGLLAVPLSRPPRQFMLWFRPEMAQVVTWGGDPNKPVELLADGQAGLTPRHSFAAWREEVRGRSRPWQVQEVVAAGELRDLVLEVLLRRAEELAGINAQLARSNEELEAFAYVASHDIREPLRQIETFASLLERAVAQVQAPPEARIGRWVEGIESSSRRLRTLIDDLTEFSRLGRQAQAMATVPLAESLSDATADLAQAVAESEAEIAVDGTLPDVFCDHVQIRRVLQNLISNAIKYRAPQRPPRITISAFPVAQEAGRRDRPMARVVVSDNGIGFEPRHAERIFEPFQRLHGAERYPGSGIGLAICRKIIDRHGGVIAAEGRPGEGATVWFTVPLPPAEPPR
jgi:chemotaxis family two-component system sensor kinase Cph1